MTNRKHINTFCVCVFVCVYYVMLINKRCLIMSCHVMNLLQHLYLLHNFVWSSITELQKTNILSWVCKFCQGTHIGIAGLCKQTHKQTNKETNNNKHKYKLNVRLSLSTPRWNMAQWRYDSTHSQPQRWMEKSGQPHARALTPWDRTRFTHWVCARAGLDSLEKTSTFYPGRESKIRLLGCVSYTLHYRASQTNRKLQEITK